MKEPVLVVMAAGMGSRYGGLKQIDKITDSGEIIMDFSLYDAMMAGFRKVVFVIKENMESDLRELVDGRAGKYFDVEYVHQRLDDLPPGFELPEGRVKPWGTAHAVMTARSAVDGPFTVINADDYYGPSAFQIMYQYLTGELLLGNQKGKYDFCMVAYKLKNTITENGSVARGICSVSAEGFLTDIVERTKIARVNGDICFTEDEGKTWTALDEDTPVSMNFWGFSREMMDELWDAFPAFLEDALADDPLAREYFLPSVADQLIKNGKAGVRVLKSSDKWRGVTYREDKNSVKDALQSMKDKGLYPDKLWK
ncbi:MAG: nucleotidyltransferase [Eubacteriaceae bacterium]|jgi:hypothetical protein|nr:nucleotidyltransferase [Eubacteriaceae bacterium]